MFKNSIEEIKDIPLAVVLKGHWPCVFHSSTSIIISRGHPRAERFDIRIVLLAELSLQASAELQILTVACWLDFWEVDVGKSCAGAKAKEED